MCQIHDLSYSGSMVMVEKNNTIIAQCVHCKVMGSLWLQVFSYLDLKTEKREYVQYALIGCNLGNRTTVLSSSIKRIIMIHFKQKIQFSGLAIFGILKFKIPIPGLNFGDWKAGF